MSKEEKVRRLIELGGMLDQCDAYIATHQVSLVEITLVAAIGRLFSEEEINQLIAINSSPLMRRMRTFLQVFELFTLEKAGGG